MINTFDSGHNQASQIRGLSANAAGLLLEVSRGRTQFPHRPIKTGKFLIGQGRGCDLRIGGEAMPPLHSVIHHEQGRYRLEQIGESPELRINGVATSSAILRNGDRIEIGPLEFIARFINTNVDLNTQSPPQNQHIPVEEVLAQASDCQEEDLDALSAEQLIDLIEQEQKAVEEFEARTHLGEMGLLDAIQRQMQQLEEIEDLPGDVGHVLNLSTPAAAPNLHRAPSIAEESTKSLLEGLGRTVDQLSRYLEELVHRLNDQTPDQPSSDNSLSERLENLMIRLSDDDSSDSLSAA
ncbi:MAG: hypothetical protein Tsb009_15180 [Planctomycetaceae bacterium]